MREAKRRAARREPERNMAKPCVVQVPLLCIIRDTIKARKNQNKTRKPKTKNMIDQNHIEMIDQNNEPEKPFP
jgi:hypothetical protein